MAKIINIIKKFILSIPFLLVCFSIKHVYADDLNVYVNLRTNNLTMYYPAPPESQINNFIYKYQSNFYNNNFNYYYLYGNLQNFNVFIYYDEINNAYIYLNYLLPSTISDTSSDLSYNIDCSSGLFFYKNSSDEWTNSNSGSLVIRTFVLSNEDKLSYYQNMIPNGTSTSFRTVPVENFNFYYYNGGTGLHKDVNKYICNNKNNLKLIYAYANDLYIDNVKQDIYVDPAPDPEPEIPILPPYNFNDNKYYVPNYHEGQCVEVLDKDTLRVFENENSYNYTDYFINSNYISKTGQVDIDYVKHCSSLEFTDIRYYSTDFPEILFMLTIICVGTFGFPYLLYKRFRKR